MHGSGKISVIVPVYNVEKYLVRCVSSIQKQSYQNIEIILVNDGSSDNSGKMCDQLAQNDNRIRVIHQKNIGLSGARNAGLHAAQGDYIGFVDSDDWIAVGFYEHLLELAIRYNADVVTSSYLRTSRMKTNIHNYSEKIQLLDKEEALKRYLFSIIKSGVTDASCWSKLYKKDVIANTQFPVNKMYEDIVFNWQIINNVENYVASNYIGYFYYRNQDSLTSYKSDTFSTKILDLIYAANKLQHDYKGNDIEIKNLLEQYLAKAYFSVLVRMLKSKGFCDEGLKYEILTNAKSNYGVLMKSSLSFVRKCVLTIIKVIPFDMVYKFI